MPRSALIWFFRTLARLLVLSINLAAAAVVIACIGAGYLFWKVGDEPQSLSAITPWLVSQINSNTQGFDLSVGDAEIARTGERLYSIQLRDVVVRQRGAQTVALTVPVAEVGFSLTDLFRGRVTVSSLDLVGASVRVVRRDNDEYAIGVSGEPIAVSELMRWTVNFREQQTVPANADQSKMKVGLKHAVLVFDDQKLGRVLQGNVETASLETESSASGQTRVTRGDADLSLDTSLGAVNFSLGLQPFASGFLVSADSGRTTVGQMSELAGIAVPEEVTDFPLTANARYVTDNENIDVPTFVMRATGGRAPLPFVEEAYPDTELTSYQIDLSGNDFEQINVNTADFVTSRGTFALSGRVLRLPPTPPTPQQNTLAGGGNGGAPPPSPPPSLPPDRLSVVGKMVFTPSAMTAPEDGGERGKDEVIFNLMLESAQQAKDAPAAAMADEQYARREGAAQQASANIIAAAASTAAGNAASTGTDDAQLSHRLLIRALSWRRGEGSWTLAGEIGLDEQHGYMSINGKVENFAFADLYGSWPENLIPETRAWLQRNLLSATITDGTLQVRVPEAVVRGERRLVGQEVNIALNYDDLAVTYLEGMPELQDAVGTVNLTADRLRARAQRGRIILPNNRVISLTDIALDIDDITVDDQIGFAQASTNGRLLPMLEAIDLPPLALLSSHDLKPNQFGGQADLTFDIRFPIGGDREDEEVITHVSARVTEVSVTDVIQYPITEGTFDVSVTPFGMSGQGNGKVDGLPLDIRWERPFDRVSGKQVEEYHFSGDFNNYWRENFNIRLIPGAVNGVVGMTVEMALEDGEMERTIIRFDATDAELQVRPLLFNKPRGEGATGVVVLRQTNEDIASIQNFTVEGEHLRIVGYGEYDTVANTISSLQFEDAQWLNNHLNGEIVRRKDDLYDAFVFGSFADARIFLADLGISDGVLKEEDEALAAFIAEQKAREEAEQNNNPQGDAANTAGGSPDWRVFLTLDRVLGYEGEELSAVTGGLEFTNGELRAASMRGRLSNGKGVGVVLRSASANSDDRKRMVVTSDDGGRVMRGLGYYDKARGGNLEIDFLLRNEQHKNLEGRLHLSDFVVVGEEVLDELLESNPPARAADGDNQVTGIGFDELLVPFSITEEFAYIKGLRMNNQALGITLSGNINRLEDTLQFSGTFTPLYALNTFVGNIPIFGDLLTGGADGEGVFGIVFYLTGQMAQPVIQVNPMSAITPGVFRRIIGGSSDSGN